MVNEGFTQDQERIDDGKKAVWNVPLNDGVCKAFNYTEKAAVLAA